MCVAQERDITFCEHLCCGGKSFDSNKISIDEWIGYLDGNCCYYKSKLLWTWLYYNFCCCHCYIMTLYLQNGSNERVKKRRKTMNRLFQSADKLLSLKFYVGVHPDTESSIVPSHTPGPVNQTSNANIAIPMNNSTTDAIQFYPKVNKLSMDSVQDIEIKLRIKTLEDEQIQKDEHDMADPPTPIGIDDNIDNIEHLNNVNTASSHANPDFLDVNNNEDQEMPTMHGIQHSTRL